MLHVTNGESAASALRQLGLDGDVMAWNDVLHEGPVRDLAPAAFRAERASFLASPDIDAAAILRGFEERDAALEAAAGGHVVLWFEHDLYDQLQLAQVLSAIAGMPGTTVEGVLPDDYLGTQPLETLRAWHESRRAVAPGQVAAGAAAWRALCSDDPREVERLWRAWRLAADTPMTVAITDDGRRVLAGDLDQVTLNGINRWIGGVHLTPDSCWRWNDENLRVEPSC